MSPALRALLFGLALATSTGTLTARATEPVPTAADPRVRTVTYAADQVVTLRGHYGFQMMVEFAPDERIENVAIGDSLAWQVTPNRRADTLFLKPIEMNATTNLAVVTTRRRYAFVLTATQALGPDDPDLIFRVRFEYPEGETAAIEAEAEALPIVANSAYSVSGSARLIPSRVFDDGKRTYLTWPEGAPTPAVFAVVDNGTETVVNFSMRGSTMVVERLARAFVLRNGAEQVFLFNDGWSEPTLGTDAPRVIEPGRGRSLYQRLFGRRPAGGVK